MPRPRKRNPDIHHDAEPCPATKAMRPNTGLNVTERGKANALVRQLMRRKKDQLPEGVALADDEKELIYAEAANMLSAELRRPVGIDQIKYVAASMRTGNSPRARYTTNLTPRHHASLKAQAEAEEVSMAALMRRVLNSHFELSEDE